MPEDAAQLGPVIDSIKSRLKAHQKVIGTLDNADQITRLMFRAENDALWAAIEVLVQRLDGVDPVRVRDYFTESGLAEFASKGHAG